MRDTAEVLLQHGADVNAKDNKVRTSLSNAALNSKRDTVELLLQHGADVNAKDNEALICQKDTAELLLQHGAEVNAKDDEGRTSLTKASENGNRDTAELLL